ncbi:hypothetical protein OC834_007090 [Tilletia horrida]|nr:hypothetical protein OC834_007090 [Tilletia horrida]
MREKVQAGEVRGNLTKDDAYSVFVGDDTAKTSMPDGEVLVGRDDGVVLEARGARTAIGDAWLDGSAINFLMKVMGTHVRATSGQHVDLGKEGRLQPINEEIKAFHRFDDTSITVVAVTDAAQFIGQPVDSCGVGSHWALAVVVGPRVPIVDSMLQRNLEALHRPGRWTIGWLDSANNQRFLNDLSSVLVDTIKIEHGSRAVSREDIVSIVCPSQINGHDCGPLLFQNGLAMLNGDLRDMGRVTRKGRDEEETNRKIGLGGPWARIMVQRLMEGPWNRRAQAKNHKTWAIELGIRAAPPKGITEHKATSATASKVSPPSPAPPSSTLPAPPAPLSSSRGSSPMPSPLSPSPSAHKTRPDASKRKKPKVKASAPALRKIVEIDSATRVWFDGAKEVEPRLVLQHFKRLAGFQSINFHTTKASQPIADLSTLLSTKHTRSLAAIRRPKRLAEHTGAGIVRFDSDASATAALKIKHQVGGTTLQVTWARPRHALMAEPSTDRVQQLLKMAPSTSVRVTGWPNGPKLGEMLSRYDQKFGRITGIMEDVDDKARIVVFRFEDAESAAKFFAAVETDATLSGEWVDWPTPG